MLRITLSIILLFAVTAATVADAAWYKKTDNTIVDPIQYTSGGTFPGGDHPYSGNNLNTGGNLTGADLIEAELTSAKLMHVTLTDATLSDANLTDANLSDADLTAADLTRADLTGADLIDAILTGANLSGSILTYVWYSHNATWTDAFYYTDNEPAWHLGMDAAWRSSVGILALAPVVPEPSTLLLALFGLALLPRRRRRRRR